MPDSVATRAGVIPFQAFAPIWLFYKIQLCISRHTVVCRAAQEASVSHPRVY